MRFTSPTPSRPKLTPLGQRLLHLSNIKLSSLDAALGSREDSAALWKEVVVREAVKSAWKSVDEGSLNEISNWHTPTAMGLDVIGEEEEDEEVSEGVVGQRDALGEERWFEELLSTLGDEDQVEWTESAVSIASPDDYLDLDVDGMEAYTFPSPPTSPTTNSTRMPPSPPITISCRPVHDDEYDNDDSEDEIEVDVIEVDSLSEYDDDSLSEYSEDSDPISFIQDITRFKSVFEYSREPDPITPIIFGADSPASSCGSTEDDIDELDAIDDFTLPPPLYRSQSSTSTCSDSCCDDNCYTPDSACEELEDFFWSRGNVKDDVAFGLGLEGLEV